MSKTYFIASLFLLTLLTGVSAEQSVSARKTRGVNLRIGNSININSMNNGTFKVKYDFNDTVFEYSEDWNAKAKVEINSTFSNGTD